MILGSTILCVHQPAASFGRGVPKGAAVSKMHVLKRTGWDDMCCRQQVAQDAHHDMGSTAREATAQSRRRAPGMLPVARMVAAGDSKR